MHAFLDLSFSRRQKQVKVGFLQRREVLSIGFQWLGNLFRFVAWVYGLRFVVLFQAAFLGLLSS